MRTREKRRYTKLPPETWKIILDLYDGKTMTIHQLADEYGVSASSIAHKVSAAGRTHSPRALSSGTSKVAAVTAMPSALASMPLHPPARKRPATAEEEAEDMKRLIREAREAALHDAEMAQRLVRLGYAALTMPTDVAEAGKLARVLDQLSIVSERIQKMRRLSLGADRENKDADRILVELPIRDMTAAETAAIRHRQELEDQGHDPDTIDAMLAEEDQPPEDDVIEGEDDTPSPAPAQDVQPVQMAEEAYPVMLERGRIMQPPKARSGWLAGG